MYKFWLTVSDAARSAASITDSITAAFGRLDKFAESRRKDIIMREFGWLVGKEG